MTEIPRKTAAPGGTETLDWADPTDLPLEEVRDVFLTLSKALRAYQLYDPNNPVYKRFVQNLREALTRIWPVRDQLQILVEEERFTWMGEEAYKNDNRSESLSFLFYRDGIRDVSLKKGLEEEELEPLLEALHRVKSARQEGDDLVTILWDLDLKLFGYTAADVSGEGVELTEGGEAAGLLDVGGVLNAELGELSPVAQEEGEEGEGEPSSGKPASPAGTVKKEDFNPTLYALDEDELRYLKVELAKEHDRDVRTDVLNALFDRLEDKEEGERQEEIIGILRTLLPNFLSRGAVDSAASVIREVQELRGKKTVLAEGAESLAESLVEDLSSKEAVGELVRAVEDGSVPPDATELAELIRYLRPLALATLLKGTEETQDDKVRELLREVTHGIAEKSRDAVIRLLTSPDPAFAAGAVRLAGLLGITEAGGSLARLLEEGTPEVKRAVVETAESMPSAAISGSLQRLLRGKDRELRIAAARVLGKTKYGPAAAELKAILESKDFRLVDVTEKVAFFEAYGMLAGEGAVAFLDKVLNSKGFLGRREPPEVRAGAALGLGKVGTAAARRALEKARNDDPVVKSAVGRALKGESGAD